MIVYIIIFLSDQSVTINYIDASYLKLNILNQLPQKSIENNPFLRY